MPEPETHKRCTEWLELLSGSGYRLTSPRRIIVETLAHSTRALSPIELYDMGRTEYSQLGLVTVYRTLEKLEALRLIQRVHQGTGCHMYMRAANGHEHMLICRECKQIVYIPGENLAAMLDIITRCSGYSVEEHWLQFSGLCPACIEHTQ